MRARSWYAKCGVAGPTSASMSRMVGSRIAANPNERGAPKGPSWFRSSRGLRALLEPLLQGRELLALEADEGRALVGLLVRAEVARAVGDHPLPVRIDAGLELLDESRGAVDG